MAADPTDGMTMVRERYQRVKEVFYRVCEREGVDRDTAIDEACAGDGELRAQVESLLAAQDRSGDFLGRPALDGAEFKRAADAGAHAAEHGSAIPLAIGRYTVVRLIGEGGMGAVYEATQESPQRTVAVKVVRPGLVSGRLLRRFEDEVEALGRLQHPGIAQIHEAGIAEVRWAEGPPSRQPYFAMELVVGAPLTAFAEQRRLSARDRLALLASVCDAVHHGHQRGVIHRDLKPGNILVRDDGQPKIIDFGVARATGGTPGAAGQTSPGQIIGTLAYMAPEQVAGDRALVDTRADVYALGVVAYQLLSGRLPIDVDALPIAEAAAAIRSREPALLGAVDRALSGDPETVVHQALEKDASRRYASASDLAADLRRILNHEPVSARPATMVYQLRKFARRNVAVAVGIGVALAGLVAGTGFASWQAVSAMRQRDRALIAEGAAKEAAARAVLEAEGARRIARCLESIFGAYDPQTWQSMRQPGSGLATPRAVLDRSVEAVLQELADRPHEQAALLDRIGRAYINIGLTTQGRRALEAELSVCEHAGLSPQHLGVALESLALVDCFDQRFDDGLARQERALRLYRDAGPASIALTASAECEFAVMLERRGRFEEAERHTRRAIEIWANDPTLTRHLPDGWRMLASIMEARGDREGAERALVAAAGACGDSAGNASTKALILYGLARLAQLRGDAPAASRATAEAERNWAIVTEPFDMRAASAAVGIAAILTAQGRHDLADGYLRRSRDTARALLGDANTTVTDATIRLATSLHVQGRYPEAVAEYRDAMECCRRMSGEEHPDVGSCLFRLAQIAASTDDHPALEQLAAQAASLRRLAAALPPGHPHRSGAPMLEAYVAVALGDGEAAERAARECIAIREATIGPEHRLTAYAHTVLGGALAVQGRFDDAERELLAGEAVLAPSYGPASLMTREVHARLVSLYESWGRPDLADKWR